MLFVQRFLLCKLSEISWFFFSGRVNYQKYRAEAIKVFITCTLCKCCIKTEKYHTISLLKVGR